MAQVMGTGLSNTCSYPQHWNYGSRLNKTQQLDLNSNINIGSCARCSIHFKTYKCLKVQDDTRVRVEYTIPGLIQDLISFVAVDEGNGTDSDLKSDSNQQDKAVNPEDPALFVHDSIVAEERDKRNGGAQYQD